jgi:hypothetical protein
MGQAVEAVAQARIFLAKILANQGGHGPHRLGLTKLAGRSRLLTLLPVSLPILVHIFQVYR